MLTSDVTKLTAAAAAVNMLQAIKQRKYRLHQKVVIDHDAFQATRCLQSMCVKCSQFVALSLYQFDGGYFRCERGLRFAVLAEM